MNIPQEIKWVILTFLPNKDILSCFLLNKEWNSLSNFNQFWKEISLRDKFFTRFEEVNEKTKFSDWKSEYKNFWCSFKGLRKVDAERDKDGKHKFDFLFKLLMVGDYDTGRSSFLLRYSENVYNDRHISTIGVDFKIASLEDVLSKKIIKIQIWDTAGEERFRTITRSYYRGAHGILLFFDITRKGSFESLEKQYWDDIDNGNDEVIKNRTVVLIGSKIDLEHKREVSYSEAKKFADSKKIEYFECSSKTNKGITQIVNYLIRKILKIKEKEEEKEDKKEKNQKKVEGKQNFFGKEICNIL